MTTAKELKEMLRARYASVAPGNGPRYVLGFEVRNQAGFGGYGGDERLRTADLIAVDTWQSGPVRAIGHEVKVTRADWLRELADPDKAGAFVPLVAEWWVVAADRGIVRDGELPPGWGLMVPAGRALRAVVPARKREQPLLPLGLTAALLRSVHGAGRAEVDAARRRPWTGRECPRGYAHDRPSRWTEAGPEMVEAVWPYESGPQPQIDANKITRER